MPESEVLNASQAAAFLGVHVQTVRRLAKKRQIPCFKVGTDWRFRREALVRWTDSQHLEDSDHCSACSVLVIDDEEKVCQALSNMLVRFGCHTRQATGGVDALKLVAEEVPSLILLDLKMPDMNGPQFLAELRKVHLELPVVIITGYPDSKLMQQASQYAPVMLLAKPVEPELLERTVRTAVGENLKTTVARRTNDD